MNLIALAIPVFFALIGLEYVASRLMGRDVYRFADALTDLSCGIGNQMTKVLFTGLLGLPYVLVWANWRWFDLGMNSVTGWLIAFVWVDFAYYWWHRLSHEVNFMWAAHIVHHQSEDYNLAVALRQALFTSFTSWPFYLPLAVLGVHPAVLAANLGISLLYQFWIHTQLIGKLGPLEWVVNTPSHHRVHHGVNPEYIDKNYAGILIVWDRLFGSFELERAPVVYGTVKRLNSWNPLWANLAYWHHLYTDARAAGSWQESVAVWFKGPTYRPRTLEPYPPIPEVHPDTTTRWDTEVSWPLTGYLALHFLPVAAAVVHLLQVSKASGWGYIGCWTTFVLLTTLSWGGLLERKPWALPVETTRLLLGAWLVLAWTQNGWAFSALVAVSGASLAVLWIDQGRVRPSPVLTR